MEFKINTTLAHPVIELSGHLTIEQQSKDLIKHIETEILPKNNKLIIDLAQLEYLNSTGLSALIVILTKARKANGEVIIANVNNTVNKLLVITKLNTVFTITDSVEEAIKLL